MRRSLPVLLLILSGTATAQDLPTQPPKTSVAIERGLNFLAKDAMAWKSEHNCASCHHAALVVWAMREAKQRGYAVDEPVLNDLTTWMAESGDGKTGVPRPAGIPKALNVKPVFFALALGVNPKLDDVSREGRNRLLKTVEEDQTADGSWASWPGSRPPILGNSDDSTTSLAALALLPAAEAGDASAKSALDLGVAWLSTTKTDDDPQSIALRLILWNRLGRPASEWEPLLVRVKARQNADGGWSQSDAMPSDAWATGQALYALAQAGLKPDDTVIVRGRDFLVASQRPDGSWPMTSRPSQPGGDGSKSLIPIIGAGSSWAVLGLAASSPSHGPIRLSPLGECGGSARRAR